MFLKHVYLKVSLFEEPVVYLTYNETLCDVAVDKNS